MAVKNTDFVDASAFLRVQEKRLLVSSGLERAIDAPNAAEALRMLSQNSDYDFAGLRDPSEYEGALKAELRRVYDLAYRLAKENRAVVDILSSRYDFHNVKTAVKAARFTQRTENPYIRVTETSPEAIGAQATDPKDKPELPGHLAEAVAAAQAEFDRTGNPQSIDIAADKAMFAHMIALCEEVGVDFITDYVRMSIDLYNIKTLLRVKSMQKGTAFLGDSLVSGGKTPVSFFAESYTRTSSAMAPVFYYKYFGGAMRAGIEQYEKSGNLSQLERLFDNMLISHTKAAKYVSFGPEILFAYIISKENEIRQVRILCTCKLNQIGAEVLRERLRDNYA